MAHSRSERFDPAGSMSLASIQFSRAFRTRTSAPAKGAGASVDAEGAARPVLGSALEPPREGNGQGSLYTQEHVRPFETPHPTQINP